MRTILPSPPPLLLPLVLMLGLGPGCGGDEEEDLAKRVCGAGRDQVDEAVYDALTTHRWFDEAPCTGNEPLPPTCHRLELHGDGTYTWRATSDVLELDLAGPWNFRARDATGGVVCLSDGSVIDFELTAGGGLRWGPLGELAPEGSLAPGPGRDALPVVAAAPLFVELTAHPWVKTNEMDLYQEAQSFTLRADGTFDAEFRDGACATGGTFSLARAWFEPTDPFHLRATTAPNQCDTRNGGSSFDLYGRPVIEDDLLFLIHGVSYRDAADATEQRLLRFSAYSGLVGLTVTATWDGALRAGAPTSWQIELHNDGDKPQTARSLRIDLTPLEMTPDGFVSAGPTVVALDRALAATVPVDTTLIVEGGATFTPGPAGWALLHIEVDSSDGTQTYLNQDSYFIELK